MPIILGPDGPSLGGFVCPAVVAREELWKIGQLKPGDAIRFIAVTRDDPIAGPTVLRAPQLVASGDVLAVIESMKMEISVKAPAAGRVSSVQVKPGQTVRAGDVVALIRSD